VKVDANGRPAIAGVFNGLLDLGGGLRLAGEDGSAFLLSLEP
jgi:hypothetical protein